MRAISTKSAAVSPRVRALSVVSAIAICAAYAGPAAAQEAAAEE
jgi:hypothetical protein